MRSILAILGPCSLLNPPSFEPQTSQTLSPEPKLKTYTSGSPQNLGPKPTLYSKQGPGLRINQVLLFLQPAHNAKYGSNRLGIFNF